MSLEPESYVYFLAKGRRLAETPERAVFFRSEGEAKAYAEKHNVDYDRVVFNSVESLLEQIFKDSADTLVELLKRALKSN